MKKSLLRNFFAASIAFSLLVIAGCSQDQCKKSVKAQAKPAACSQTKQVSIKPNKPAAGSQTLQVGIFPPEADAEIAKLKSLLEEKDKEIAQIKSDNEKEIDVFGEQLMDSLTDFAKLKEENDNLKKQVEELKKGTGQ